MYILFAFENNSFENNSSAIFSDLWKKEQFFLLINVFYLIFITLIKVINSKYL